jgi:hypothetical protein
MEFLRGCHVTSAPAAARNGTPHDDTACVSDSDGLHLEDLDFGFADPTREEMERDVMDRLGIQNLSCPKEIEIDRVGSRRGHRVHVWSGEYLENCSFGC